MQEIKEFILPQPNLKIRDLDPTVEQNCLKKGLHPLLAKIIAARPVANGLEPHEMVLPRLGSLDLPYAMADIKKAADRLATAIIKQEYIGIETDHDCDGQTSHAALFYNITVHFNHPEKKIYSYIGHRLNEGYGLSDPVVDRILQDKPQPSLIITADNGSADEPRIKRLQEAGIDVIVTDHHEIPVDGVPKSAYACLNPSRIDCDYKDKYIAGCMVAWLLMVATRDSLIKAGYLPKKVPKLLDSLDFVAVGTIADCVSMAKSKNNRAVVAYGLKHIKAGVRPCWRALQSVIGNQITSEDLAFKIAPLLNSDGRLGSAFGSVNFLLADNDIIAREWVVQLQVVNKQRKKLQQQITLQGLQHAIEQVKAKKISISIFLEDSHTGVHGISASRIRESFGRPTVFLAPKVTDAEIISGSVRGVDGFNVFQALQFIADRKPNLFISFGGHSGAGGVTFRKTDLEQFEHLFEEATKVQLNTVDLEPIIVTDGELKQEWINLNVLHELYKLEPYGKEFETPIFQATAKLLHIRLLGDGTHARVSLNIAAKTYQGVWFNFRHTNTEQMPVKINDIVRVVYALRSNEFNGNKRCELQVIFMQLIHN